ncbi:hypothetical protein BV20DRAFT_1055365 [Pilatotrama ljubarskyi]|nr:hypothetical protein BV20DRAFT_1055365 [Pilatotrama ljubarskyi]
MSTSAVDRVLSIPHLLGHVLEIFAPEWSDDRIGLIIEQEKRNRACRRNLARLARVNKTFSETALGVLWRNLDDLAVLLRVLPSFKSGRHWEMLEHVTQPDWVRFQEYAKRVQGLRWHFARSRPVHRTVWIMLERKSAGQPLLPRLRTLALMSLRVNDPVTLTVLLAPSVRNLRLSFEDGLTMPEDLTHTRLSPVGILLQLAIEAVPQLSTLHIESGLPKQMPTLPYFSPLVHLNGLEKLDLLYSGAVVDYQTLQLFSHIPSLRNLLVQLSLADAGQADDLRFGEAFERLGELHLSGSIYEIRRVIQASNFLNLTSFALSVSIANTIEDLKDALAAICNRMPQSIDDANLFCSAAISSPAMSLAEILRPYLSFDKLGTMDVEFDNYVPRVDDHDCLAFARAWPSLTRFHLSCWMPETHRRRPDPPPQPTVLGLAEFARHCPRLDLLTLPYLDVWTLPSPRSVPRSGQEALRHLQIAEYLGGETANLLDLALILDLLFPRLGCERSVTLQSRSGFTIPTHRRPVEMTYNLLGAMAARRRLDDEGSAAGDADESRGRSGAHNADEMDEDEYADEDSDDVIE